MKLFNVRLYHGSGADFDKFDLNFMGSGEGHQAHGWGIYLAENPKTARSYRDYVGKNTRTYSINGQIYDDPNDWRMMWDNCDKPGIEKYTGNDLECIVKCFRYLIQSISNRQYDTTKTIAKLGTLDLDDYMWEWMWEDNYQGHKEYDITGKEVRAVLRNIIRANDIHCVESKATFYTVEVEGSNWIWEDNPISAYESTIPGVYKAFKEIADANRIDFNELVKYSFEKITRNMPYTYGVSQKTISMTLSKYGVNGIIYDGRQDGRCYVVFNPDDITIVSKG